MDSTRREVLKGMAIGTVGMVFGPVIVFASDEQGSGSSKSLPRSSPTSLGIDPAAIEAFVAEVNKTVGGLHSMMLVRHGKVAAEAWWVPYEAKTPHVLFSLSKSFTSTGVGLAVADGKLNVEDKVVSFFPDKLPATVSENLAAMRVKDLLTMSTGHEKEPDRTSNDWVKDFFAAPVQHKPGTHFLYNTTATHVLAAIVTKVSGQRLLTYLTPRILEPLGIEGATWQQSPAGIDIGGFGLSVKTEDIAKFGQLYLQKGKWNGKQLLPAAWVEEATKKQVSNGDPSEPHDWCQGYGYQFWRCRHDHYRGDGAFGQYCIVMDDHDAVLAITSGVGDMGAVMNAAWNLLLPGFSSKGGDESSLKKKLATQEVPFPTGQASSPLVAQVSGKTYQIEDNPDGIKSVKLTFEKDRCTIEMEWADRKTKVVCGTSSWVPGELSGGPSSGKVATRGAWVSDKRFSLKTCYVDSPFTWSEWYEFDGDKVTIDGRSMNVAFGPPTRPALHGKVV